MKDVVALIPVKRLHAAKSRLAAILEPSERAILVECMLHDVFNALFDSKVVKRVIVATADEKVRRMAARRGATVFHDRWELGLGRVVTEAALHLDSSVRTMVTVPADIPLITGSDVTALIAGHGDQRGVTVVPAKKDGGSNALVTTSPAAIPFHYGPKSAVRHYEAAADRCIAARLLSISGFDIDIDTPVDLAAVFSLGSGSHTAHYLSHICVDERLQMITLVGIRDYESATVYA